MGAMITLKANGQTIRQERDDAPTLEELQAAVGGYIELVHVYYRGVPCQMFVDEEGLLKKLPRNVAATELVYESASINAAKDRVRFNGRVPYIVGDAVILDGIKLK